MKEKIYIPIRINEEILTDEIAKKLANNKDKKILLEIVDTDFTSINIKKQEEILDQINKVLKEYKAFGIKILSTPDSIDRNNLKLLKKYKVKEIELLIESSNDYILKNIGVDYKFDAAKKVAKKIKSYRFLLSVKTILGLPESTVADDLNTVRQVIKLKPEQVTLTPCNIDYNKNVEKLYDTSEFTPLSKIQLIERLKESIKLITRTKIRNIKIGEDSQSVEEMPMVQFRNLVVSEIWYEKIIEMIKSYNVKVKEVEIEVNSSDIDNVKGLNNRNLEQLKDVYDVELHVSENDKLESGNYKMKILKTYTDFLEDNEN
jgi:histone acetyltransferase (RNA polymerase elongator complex component)